MIPTPYLSILEPVVRRNIERLANYAADHGLSVRPHTKTHKSLALARLQLAAGACGLTFAKVGEAEVLAAATDDVLLGYPTVDSARTQRVARLAREKTTRVAVDTAYAIDALAEAAVDAGTTVGILVDIDVGMHRTGVQTPAEALKLAQRIDQAPGLRLDGLFCYPGHILSRANAQAEPLASVSSVLRETLDLWRRSGLAAAIVSGGSTPTAYQSHLVPELTEIRPGTSIFNDMNTVYGGYCTLADCAAAVVCTVVSDAVPGKVVIDAGSKTLTSDMNWQRRDSGFGHVLEYPDAVITRLSEEHGEIDITRCDRKPAVGERVRLIPNHICPCVNLQDNLWLRNGDEESPLPIDARGRLS